MHQWAGIALGLVIIIALIVLYMSRSSGFEPTPVDVVPTQLPVVPNTPPTPVMEPSPVIDHQYVSNTIPVTDMDSFPESMSFTSLKVFSDLSEIDSPSVPSFIANTDFSEVDETAPTPAGDTPKLVKLEGPSEDIEMTHSSMYSEWSP